MRSSLSPRRHRRETASRGERPRAPRGAVSPLSGRREWASLFEWHTSLFGGPPRSPRNGLFLPAASGAFLGADIDCPAAEGFSSRLPSKGEPRVYPPAYRNTFKQSIERDALRSRFSLLGNTSDLLRPFFSSSHPAVCSALSPELQLYVRMWQCIILPDRLRIVAIAIEVA